MVVSKKLISPKNMETVSSTFDELNLKFQDMICQVVVGDERKEIIITSAPRNDNNCMASSIFCPSYLSIPKCIKRQFYSNKNSVSQLKP